MQTSAIINHTVFVFMHYIMSSKKSPTSRTLGHARGNVDYINGKHPLPPVHKSRAADFTEGFIVSSMTLPPQKPLPTPNSATRQPSSPPPISNSMRKPEGLSSPSAEDYERRLREKDRIIKEKDKEIKEKSATSKNKDNEIKIIQTDAESLRDRVIELEKECRTLRHDIMGKEMEMVKVKEALADHSKVPEIDYRELYEAEVNYHGGTKDELAVVESQLESKTKQLELELLDHERKIDLVQKKMELRLSEQQKSKDAEIAERDDKLRKLKKQIADQFTGNSWERQQQIDELTKELSKIQGECDNLRSKLRHTNGKMCPNCSQLTSKLDQTMKLVKDKERQADELSLVCGRLETQLKQQEELIKQWQNVKGRVLVFDK